MELSYYGAGCIFIVTKQLSLLVDPFQESHGLKIPKVKADVVLYSTQQKSPPVKSDFIIDSPGEYETKNVSINGIPAQVHIDKPEDPFRGIMYTIEAGDVRLLVTGNIAPTVSTEQQEAIGTVHIMVIPVGGHGLTLDGNAAATLVSRFEPQYIVPIHYHDSQTKYPSPQDGLDTFLQELGGEIASPVDKLKVTNKNLDEEAKLIILKRLG